MSLAGLGSLDNADLGLAADSDDCRALAQELGSAPPWPVSSLQAYFDRIYPGWDDAPQLALSSPVSRLRGLAEAAEGGDEEAATEALRELRAEVKHAQIRVMCPRVDNGSLTDECNFLLLTLASLGERLLAEKEARRREQQAAAQQLAEERESRRTAVQEAAADVRAAGRQQLEELATELESQQRQADGLQRKAEGAEAHRAEMEQRVEELEHELLRSRRAHENSQEELEVANAQSKALAVARKDSEGALEDLRRKLEKATATALPGITTAAVSGGRRGGGGAGLEEFFAKGARAALALSESSGTSMVRLVFLAWRYARVEAQYARLGEAATATSLQADLSVVGCSPVTSTLCCCKNPQESCCRKPWLEAALNLLGEEASKAKLANAQAAAAVASAAAANSSAMWHRLGTAMSLSAFLCLLMEPQLGMSW